MATPARVFHKPAWRGRAGVRVAAVAALWVPLLAGCETIFEEEPEVSVAPIITPAAPETLTLAQRALAEQRYGDASKLLERVLIADPENLEARLLGALTRDFVDTFRLAGVGWSRSWGSFRFTRKTI